MPPKLWEIKSFTPHACSRPIVGNGCASNTEGHFIAFGNTREFAIEVVLGRKEKPGERPFDHRTGVGSIKAKKGDYDDALQKGHPVTLLLSEPSGALCPNYIRLLRACAKKVKENPGIDTTTYGNSRSSTKSFFAHHLAAASSAIVGAFANSIMNTAASLMVLATLASSAPGTAHAHSRTEGAGRSAHVFRPGQQRRVTS